MNRAAAVFLAFAFACSAAHASDAGFVSKIRRLPPGTAQERVLEELGEPEAVVSQSVDPYGRRIEVWRYLPGIEIPARRTLGASTDAGSFGLSLPASTTVPGNTAGRMRQDLQAWDRVQKASYSNPADPFYSPVRSSDAPVRAPAVPVIPAYFVTFADGVVQDVRYSEERIS